LISAVPIPNPRKQRSRERIVLTGDTPSTVKPPSGCRFRTRCPTFLTTLGDEERDRCIQEQPLLTPASRAGSNAIEAGRRHAIACHYPREAVLLPPRETRIASDS
jgi:hypothetical protein